MSSGGGGVIISSEGGGVIMSSGGGGVIMSSGGLSELLFRNHICWICAKGFSFPLNMLLLKLLLLFFRASLSLRNIDFF